MRVGIDLDGVCYSFDEALARHLVHMGLGDPSKFTKPQQWHFYGDWGLTKAEFLMAMNDSVDNGQMFRGPAIKGAPEALRAIKADGHSLHVVTARNFGSPEVAEAATREWLHAHEIPFDTLTFSEDKTVVRTECFVEDKLENYDALATAGVRPYLVNQPWNVEPLDWRRRVDSITEFAEDIISMRIK